MRTLKVFQVVPQLIFGGAEIMVENLSYELQDIGVEVHIISFFNVHNEITARITARGIKIHFLGKKIGFDLSLIIKLYKLFMNERPDVIHTHIGGINYAMPAAIMAGIEGRVHTIHSIASMETSIYAKKINNIYYRLFKVIPVSIIPTVKMTINKEYGINPDLIPMIYNGVDFRLFKPKNNYTFNNIIRIVCIGRLEKEKNHVLLIKVLAKIILKFPNVELSLVGNGSLKQYLEGEVRSLNLAKNIKFLGLRNDISGLLNKADIFVLPSNYEGMPITLIEAMITGLPIVATNVGGVPDMIRNEKEGLLVDVDGAQIEKAIEKMIDNEGLRTTLGEQAHIAARRFSSRNMMSGYLKLYRSLLS